MDISVENHGSIVLLRPLNDVGRAWLDDQCDPDRIVFGGATVCEPRYVADIIQGARADGIEIG